MLPFLFAAVFVSKHSMSFELLVPDFKVPEPKSLADSGKPSVQSQMPLETLSVTTPRKKPQVLLIIDDLGDNYRLGKRVVNLPVPVNLSFLPNTPFARKLALQGHQLGHDIMLHLPMQATTRSDLLGNDALTLQHDQTAMAHLFDANLHQIPFVAGFNNHMGSLLTRSEKHMKWLMQLTAEKQLYFVDSRTAADSIAHKEALRSGIPSLSRDVFLDPADGSFSVEKQLYKALKIADRYGKVVIIGHPHRGTLAVLEKELPFLSKHYEWLTVSAYWNARQRAYAKSFDVSANKPSAPE